MTRHNCGRQGWSECVVCGGRLHMGGCTSPLRPDRDCMGGHTEAEGQLADGSVKSKMEG